MSATQDRIKKIIASSFDIGHEPDFNAQLVDIEVTSMEAVAFYKLVNDEFGLGMEIEDFAQFRTLQELVGHIDARG
ncbi:MAG: acyl carrier protein [Nitrospinae bacterium]|nr:acyl carrier protein [Nitrospinota bacterium]